MNGSGSGNPPRGARMRPLQARRGFVLLLWVLVATSCADQGQEGTNATELAEEISAEVEQFLSEQTEGGFNFRGQAIVSGESAVTITLEEFSFEPTIIASEPGQELGVFLVNEGDGPHTFTLDDQDVHVALRRGQNGEATVSIASSDAPTLFYCRFHRDQGMVGVLTQVPPT